MNNCEIFKHFTRYLDKKRDNRDNYEMISRVEEYYDFILSRPTHHLGKKKTTHGGFSYSYAYFRFNTVWNQMIMITPLKIDEILMDHQIPDKPKNFVRTMAIGILRAVNVMDTRGGMCV